jgi:Putative peptidoglycan binding domain
MDANSFLKRIILVGLLSALPTFLQAAPPGGGGHFSHGGSSGGHFAPGMHSGARPGVHNFAWNHGSGHWNGHGDWHGGGNWNGHGDWHGHWGHHHHDRFFFGFYPYWYPGWGWGYYDYGYPYYGDYWDDYPDYYYPSGGRPASMSLDTFVQDGLARRGYYSGQIDGVIGPQTRSAIREFQSDNNLPVTGRIDSQLVHALRSS